MTDRGAEIGAVAPPGRRAGIGGVLAMLALALALRAPIVTVPPVVSNLQGDLRVSSAAVALLTSIPVLCFGLVTPGSSTLLRVLGLRTSGMICLIGVVLGSLLRSGGSFPAAILGTFLIGAAISIGNLVVPVLIGRHYPFRAPALMGGYTATMNVGATAATATTAALAAENGWQLATAVWGVVLGGVGLALWLALAPRETAPDPAAVAAREAEEARDAEQARTQPVWRNPLAWLLGVSFGTQSMAFFTVSTWLPSALQDSLRLDQVTAGWGAAGFQVAGILGPLLVPVFIALFRPAQWVLVLVIACLWALLPVGMLVLPQWWPGWVLASGLAQGAFFTAMFVIIVARARGSDENRRLTAHVQTMGYLLAATGPVLMGWLHERLPSWDVLFLVIAGLVLVMATTGVLAARRPPAAAVAQTATQTERTADDGVR